MKRIIIITLCIFLSAPAILSAKNKKNRSNNDYSYIDYKRSEVFIQYGSPTITELTNKLESKTYKVGETTHKYKDFGTKYTGVGGVGYNFYINPYLYLGAYFGISEADMRIQDEKTSKDIYTNHVRNYTGMLSIGWIYFRDGIWEASCGCSLGLARKDESQELLDPKGVIPTEKDSFNFAYNLTATKVRVGGIVGGFLEVGFGYKGLINAGLSVKF